MIWRQSGACRARSSSRTPSFARSARKALRKLSDAGTPTSSARVNAWENRPRRFNYRGPILIHASKSAPEADYLFAVELIESLTGRAPPARNAIERGGIVGAAELTNCAEPL